jgi:diguanylate cyclase (GGDEF)-like protein
MDIDHFKRFNDTYGHDAGDVVIQAVAEQLRRFVRGSDVAARHGGEEFVLWMPGARKADAARRAEDLREQVRRLSLAHGGTGLPTITLSLGVATFSEDGDNFETLLKAADLALYEAKHAGRDRVVLAAPARPNAERDTA